MPKDPGKVEVFLASLFDSVKMPEPHKTYWAHLLSRPTFWIAVLLVALALVWSAAPGLRPNIWPFAQQNSPSESTSFSGSGYLAVKGTDASANGNIIYNAPVYYGQASTTSQEITSHFQVSPTSSLKSIKDFYSMVPALLVPPPPAVQVVGSLAGSVEGEDGLFYTTIGLDIYTVPGIIVPTISSLKPPTDLTMVCSKPSLRIVGVMLGGDFGGKTDYKYNNITCTSEKQVAGSTEFQVTFATSTKLQFKFATSTTEN